MSGRALATLGAVAVSTSLALAAPAQGADGHGVSVQIDRTSIATDLGHTFSIRSRVTNRGPTPSPALIAHLNVLSYERSVYVDPEDWSSSRTRYLAPIPARGSTPIVWRLQAVNAGRFAVYVSFLPQRGAPGAPTTAPAVRVRVVGHRTLNASGVLPLALGLPALLAVAATGVRIRRRKHG